MPYADPARRKAYQREYRLTPAQREKANERARAWYHRHRAAMTDAELDEWRDQGNARQRDKRAADPERFRLREKRYRDANKEKRRLAGHARYHANPEYFAVYGRRRILRDRGLTEESYLALKTSQGFACAICLSPFPEKPEPHIDHDHATGVVRGLLCGPCNQGIGLLRESAAILERAAAYLADAPDMPA